MLVETATLILTGGPGAVQGLRRVVDLMTKLSDAEAADPEVHFLRDVGTELDDRGPGRSDPDLWSAEIVAENQRTTDDYLRRSWPQIESACRAIIGRYSTP